MNNHIVDPNKKVLSAAQIRVMAEIDGWKWGEYQFYGKWLGERVPCSPSELATKRVRIADMSLPLGANEAGAYPDFNDYNISMGVLERWKNRGANLYDREWNIGSDGTGYYADLRMNQNSKGIPKRQEINNADSPIIAIAEALKQIEEK